MLEALWESLLVMLGGAVGSLSRFWVNNFAVYLFGIAFPIGTLGINILGSFILGFLVAWGQPIGIDPKLRLLLGTGFCGGFTTFSTFSIESLVMLEKGDFGLGLLYIFGNVLGGIVAAFGGVILARSL
ncbi:MAG: fluoride efflux transporter CrcB [Anaerolineae bacterium]|nr:fluoride efflux transporter CrcB [Gloeobacterales cyanobacterium ES-bin-313]